MTKVKKPGKSKVVKGKAEAKLAAKSTKAGAASKKESVKKLSVKGLKEQKVKELSAAAKKAKKQEAVEVMAAGPMDEKVTQLSSKWSSLYKKSQNMDVSTYDMRKTFEPKTAIEHKTLGWGYIMENRNDRLEVLFKDGIRFLISNYKG